MKQIKLLWGILLLAGLSASGSAYADGGHWHGHGHSHFGLGLYFGAPYPYYPYPYYTYPYYPPVVGVPVPAQPPVYIERGDAGPGPGGYWYHCTDPEGYYPYIQDCPGGWDRVRPTPPPQ